MLRSIWILYLFGMFFIEVSFSDNQVVTYEVYSPKDSAPTHVDCQATESAFPCDDVKQQCIAREKVCDAVWDCEGGKDETVEVCGCLPHEFQCNASVCIDAVRRCDRLDDCEDGSDEDNCGKSFLTSVT
ncbi:G-protein coupled receptor GRL101 [Aplysia californica]|uniref:G-protein coupled receptor GRL101 n=1 Tax=Aplysia californica TaxID=6500 RepID=A0ABM0JX97_APLCA|nr:G-protein coupled receptor GRL101 [Aplysia californica]